MGSGHETTWDKEHINSQRAVKESVTMIQMSTQCTPLASATDWRVEFLCQAERLLLRYFPHKMDGNLQTPLLPSVAPVFLVGPNHSVQYMQFMNLWI